MRNPLTPNQSKLTELATVELRKIGGHAAISRSKDRDIRELGKTEGTREWALLKTMSITQLTDDQCAELIEIIEA